MKEQNLQTETHLNQITFFLNGKQITEDVPAGISTLDWLHAKKQMFGTKCSIESFHCFYRLLI